jgi:hypothetical protein
MEVSSFESLPPELLIQILLQLPLRDIAQASKTSRRLNSTCQDWTYWSLRAQQELDFPPALFRQTLIAHPIQQYRKVQQYHQNPSQYLSAAVVSGNNDLLQYLLAAGANNATMLVTALDNAAKKGNLKATQLLLRQSHFPQRNAGDVLVYALALAAKNNHVAVAEELSRAGARDLSYAIAEASDGQFNQKEIWV